MHKTPVARPQSGHQVVLRSGEAHATIASVGASLREFRVAGRDLVVPFVADEIRPAYRGATVAPWPNRVVDGRYEFDGEVRQLALTEVTRGHALHGFTPWLEFTVREVTSQRAVLEAVVEAQAGYPWRVAIETEFVLDGQSLTQRVTATNLSDSPAPYGVCPHPYLVAGPGTVDDWQLTLPAATVATTAGERLLPTGLASVEVDAPRFDFREPRVIGAAEIDHAFTDVTRDAAGVARVELRAADGTGVAMSWDDACRWVQVHTADLPTVSAPGHRAGLAVEPMTCAPDAFNGGESAGLVSLAGGETHSVCWAISALN